jgi:ATP-dependent 26S proteasome regulatory subunit
MNSQFQHLQLYLSYLDSVIYDQVQKMQQFCTQNEDPSNAYSAVHFSGNQAYDLLQRPFSLKPKDHEGIHVEYFQRAVDLVEIEGQIPKHIKETQDGLLPFQYLALVFNLNHFAVNVILTCLAPALDLRYQKLYGYLLDDMTRTRPTPNMILDLLVEPGPERLEYLHYFADESLLFKYRLIQHGAEPGLHDPSLLNQPLAIDPTLVHWVLGVYEPAAAIRDFVTFDNTPMAELACLSETQQTLINQAVESEALLLFYGRDTLAQQTAVLALAQQQERSLLTLDLVRAVKAGLPAQEAIEWALRDARLVAAVVQITGWEACLEEGAPPVALFTTLCDHPGPVVIVSATRWQPRQVARQRRLLWLEFALPDHVQRHQLLTHFLGEQPVDPDLDLATLAGEFKLTSGQLRDLVNSAIDQATGAGRAVNNADLFAAARSHSNPRLATLATKLTPRHTRADIILPPDPMARLVELINKVRYRTLVLHEWGMGEKLAAGGINALFCGKPGTGKTMAAQIVAHELGMDVYRIDLSSMVSKYIGETEKNLERVFTEAESSNAILFFDEADALFGKRSDTKDAHDRYANIEVSYLLQRMDTFDGVTILATNLRANLDEAFTRRFDTIIDFPFPEEGERLCIWQTLLPAKVPKAPDLDLRRLARTFKLAGGSIRNIIVDAGYRAAADGKVLTMLHLLQSTRREVQKMGWLVNEKDFVL